MVGEGRSVQGAQTRLGIASSRSCGSCASGCSSSHGSPSSCSPPFAGRTTPRARAPIIGTESVPAWARRRRLYLATRHFFVTYAIEELGLSIDDVGWYCGHRGQGGQIVRAPLLAPRRRRAPGTDRRQARARRTRERATCARGRGRGRDARQASPPAAQCLNLRDTFETPNPRFAGTFTCLPDVRGEGLRGILRGSRRLSECHHLQQDRRCDGAKRYNRLRARGRRFSALRDTFEPSARASVSAAAGGRA